jgi:MFS family permease
MAFAGMASGPVRGRSGFLGRDRIVARPGFNRWLVPPAALAIHLCIGMAYGFSVFWLPLQTSLSKAAGAAIPTCAGKADTFGQKLLGTATALTATTCEWTQFDLGWMFTLFFLLLGISAAIWGGWLERAGPRKAGVVAAFCWCGGMAISALGVAWHQLWLMWLGSGVIGGVGLGLGYISPVSTLIKWFPDRRGMATGMAIMGFGGGALIGSPLAAMLINGFSASIPYVGSYTFAGFRTATTAGVWETFLAMAAIYFVFMMGGALGYRLPPARWTPARWDPAKKKSAMITHRHVHLHDAHKTAQFWLIWLVLCMNVSAGIGIIGAASPMLQETFGGRLFGDPSVGFAEFNADQVKKAAAVGAAFVGLFSLFNILGRFFWASLSDGLGRKTTYFLFFVLGFAAYASAPSLAGWGALAVFAAAFCLIASMYGGGFATVPAYLADIFGTHFVGAIHGRLLTAWSTAGIIGPVVVNYLHDTRKAQGIPPNLIYQQIFYVLAGMLVVGFFANLLIRPLKEHHFMDDEEADKLHGPPPEPEALATQGIGRGGIFRPGAILAWAIVGVPLAWGVWITLQKAAALF